jgi:hypothetical protein
MTFEINILNRVKDIDKGGKQKKIAVFRSDELA